LPVLPKIMIILLYGEDRYRIGDKLKEIIQKYEKKGSVSLKRFQDFSFKDIKEEIRQRSMFEEAKLLILENPFSSAQFKEEFLKEHDAVLKSKDILVFCQEGEVPKPLLQALAGQNGKCQKFDLLSGLKLIQWMRNKGLKAEYPAEKTLVEYVGPDLWRMGNEITKIMNYTKNSQAKKEDVELLVRPIIENNIFKTIDSIADRNKALALKLVKKHLQKGDSPLYVFSMINYQFRNLLVIKELLSKGYPFGKILAKTGLNPFVVKKTCWQAERFSFEELKKIYRDIFRAELEIKTGKMDPEEGIEMLVSRI